MPNWTDIRADFPILNQQIHGKPLIYFDNGATSQKPRQVIEATTHYYEHDNANVHRGLHALSNRATDAYEAARTRLAQYFNAASEGEIIFTRGTTESINLVANTWGVANLKAGDVILLTEMEHHSNMVPWQLLASRLGAQVRYVPINAEGEIDLAVLQEMLTPEVKLFSFVHISNSLGTLNPAKEFCRMAREKGIVTLVDAAQSAGHMKVDVQEIGCDFMACSGHKMCGPTGIGLLYGRKVLLDAMPPWHGGGEMILRVEYAGSTWKPAPFRFEAGTPAIAEAIGLRVAADYLDAIGREAIFQHDQDLAMYAYEQLKQVPGIILLGSTGKRGGLVSFVLEQAHAHDVVSMADEYGLALRGGHHCTQPLMRKLGYPSSNRASFYFYNTRDEVDRMVEIIQKIAKFFQ